MKESQQNRKIVRDLPQNSKIVRDVPQNSKIVRDVPRNRKIVRDLLQNRKIVRVLPVLCDVLFALWLFTEVGMEHSGVSRACMLLFLIATLLLMCFEKKAFFSYWMPFAAGMILWSLIGARTVALSPEASLHTVKTLVINLAFLFFLYQYFLLRRTLRPVFTAYMAAAGALMAYMLLS